jgi:hypothetical protein
MAQLLAEEIRRTVAEVHTLTDFEQTGHRILQQVGQRALAMAVEAEEERYPAAEMACRGCGQGMAFVRRRSAQLRTVMGPTTVKRAYYLCPFCHRGHYPLDERLGLRPNALSLELERVAALTGALLPFEKGCVLLEALTLVSVSDQTMDKATQAYGAAVSQREQEWQATAFDQAELQKRKREVRPPLRLYGTIDATKVHTRGDADYPWRDLKVGAWFEARGQPPKSPDGQWSIQAQNIHYYTDIGPALEFGSLMWATGVQRHAQLARELIILGDGAEWIWNLVAALFPKAIQILDWFHASEYLAPVAQAAFATPAEQEAWLSQAKQALWNGRVDQVIGDCLKLARTEDSSDPAFVAARYYHQNRQRMDYPAYRRQGYQIGSGTIESAAKQIGTMRMKVPGATWNHDSARKVAKARAAYLSGEWPELAAYRALPLVT